MADSEDIPLPQALPLVFTRHSSRYISDVSCLYNNDSFTEILNEDFDSYVMTPWAWTRDSNTQSTRKILILFPIASVTLITNILVIATFVREKMMSALNVILIGISVSDTLTVLIPAVATSFMYLDGIFPDYIAYEHCRLFAYLTKYLPTITHTAALWLTLVLAYDRYVAIRHPFLVRRLCVPRTSVTVIVFVYLLATLGHICRFVDTEYVPVKIISANNTNCSMISASMRMSSAFSKGFSFRNSLNKTNINLQSVTTAVYNVSEMTNNDCSNTCKSATGIQTCRAVYTPFFADFKQYEFCYYWFVILFVKLLPCFCMIILDSLMLKALRHAERIRHVISAKALERPLHRNRSKYKESQRLTRIVIIAIVIVTLVELPIGLILVFWTLAEIHGYHFITERELSMLSRTANSIVYVSYPVLFVLYCCVSSKFRRVFCRLCCYVRQKCSTLNARVG